MALRKSETALHETERILKALANRRRLTIARFLAKQKEATVGEVSEAIHLSFKATSKHLAILATSNIVDRDQRSIQAYYRLSINIPVLAKHIISIL